MAGAIVQSKQVFVTNPTGTTQTVTLTGTTAGNSIWAVGHDGFGINKAMTCADNVNGSYGTQLDNVNDSANGNTIRHWLKANIAGGTVTVTLTLPGSDGFSGLYAAEVSGVTTSPLDGHLGNNQGSVTNGGTITTGAITNTATAFGLALTVQDSSTAGHATVGAGFTSDPNFTSGLWNNGANSAIVEFQASMAASSAALTFTNGVGSTQTFNTVGIKLDESGGSGVTVALTGQGASFSPGNLTPSSSIALTGQQAAFSSGSLIPGLSLALLGQSAGFVSGLLVPATTIALLGIQAVFSSGTVIASGGGNVTVALTGQAATFAAGTLAPTLSVALSGQRASITAGVLSPATALSLTGLRATFATGSLTASSTIALTGQAATFTAGHVTAPGDVTVALTGSRAVFAAGQLSVGGLTMPNLIGLHWIAASHVVISAGLTQTQNPLEVKSTLPVPPGTVVGQSIAPGNVVQPGTDVVLTATISYLLSASFDVIPWYV